jgi:hypothetical protein
MILWKKWRNRLKTVEMTVGRYLWGRSDVGLKDEEPHVQEAFYPATRSYEIFHADETTRRFAAVPARGQKEEGFYRLQDNPPSETRCETLKKWRLRPQHLLTKRRY